jgi:predicted transposase YbfD/YdcC
MSSSPVIDCAVESDLLAKMPLLDMITQIRDPRARRGIRHGVRTIVIIALAAMMCGSDCLTGFAQWANHTSTALRRRLGITTIPSESTIRRTLQRLDPVFFDNLAGCWTWLRRQTVKHRTVISLDGKTIRGARTDDQTAPHIVAAMLHHSRSVVAQKAVTTKSNEIPCLRDLLKSLVITGHLIVADALHCQVETARQIIKQGADYLFCAKSNQPGLVKACQALPWTTVKQRRFTDDSHGRHVVRSIRVIVNADRWIAFPGVTIVAQVTRTRTDKKSGKKSKPETVYLLSSLPIAEASHETIATHIRNHWQIENSVHWVRDVTFNEDARRIRTGHTPHILATLANLVIAILRLHGQTNLAQARRDCQWNPNHLTKLLLTT